MGPVARCVIGIRDRTIIRSAAYRFQDQPAQSVVGIRRRLPGVVRLGSAVPGRVVCIRRMAVVSFSLEILLR